MKDLTDYKKSILLVVIGVTLYAALMNFSIVVGAILQFLGIFSPLVIGGVIAFILNVPMKGIERRLIMVKDKINGKPFNHVRILSVVLTYIGLIAVLTFIGSVVIPSTAGSVKNIADLIRENYPVWIDWLGQKGVDVALIEKYVGSLDFDVLMEKLIAHSNGVIAKITGSLGSVIGTVGSVGIGFIFSIYILLAKERLGRQAKMLTYSYIRKDWADKLCDVAKLSHRTFSKFISGQCLEAVIIGALFAISLFIARMPYSATIAIVIGSTSLIPIIGAFIGCVFGLLLIVTVSTKQAIIFLVIFFVIQQFEGHVIYPNVVGNSVGLPAIWTMLAVVVGGTVGGIGGIILFIPLFSVIYVLIKKDARARLDGKKADGEIINI